MKPLISITDCSTGETIEREMTDAEYERHSLIAAEFEANRPVTE